MTKQAPRLPSLSLCMAYVVTELKKPSSFLLPLRLFMALAWFRAAAEKLMDPNWFSGQTLTLFLQRQLESGFIAFPFYEFLVNQVFLEQVVFFAKLVLLGQVAVAVALAFGLFSQFALLVALFMNLNFVLVGAVNPSVFYMAMQLVLLYAHAGASLGLDGFLNRRLKQAWLVAQTDYRIAYTERRPFLVSAFIIFYAAILTVPFVKHFDPVQGLHDSALFCFVLMNMVALFMLLKALTSHTLKVEMTVHEIPYIAKEIKQQDRAVN